jgi:hypothetical protein
MPGMYFAMEKAGHAHDEKNIFFFCISEAKRLGHVNRKRGKVRRSIVLRVTPACWFAKCQIQESFGADDHVYYVH